MYLHAGEGLTMSDPGLGKDAGGCAPDATLKGTLCWFNSTNSASVAAVYVPAAALRADPVCILVWIHGDIIPCGDEGKDGVSYVRSKEFPLALQIADSKRPYVLVVPTMKWTSGRNKVSHALGSPKTMNAFVEEVRTGLVHAGWSKAPLVNRLILAGHSRAYVVLNALAAAVGNAESSTGALGKLTDVWLLDATYGKKNRQVHCSTWIAWASAHTKAPSIANLHISYRKASDTSDVAECIRDEAAKARLTNVTVRGFPSHCSLPRDQMPALLAASVIAPRTSRFVGDSGFLGDPYALGQTPPPQVTDGEFGKALASLDPPPTMTRLLRLSKTFMDMARTLDKKYVYLWHPAGGRHRTLDTSTAGVVKSGGVAGRRVLDIRKSLTGGARFEPYQSPDNTGYYDVIWIDKPTQGDTGRWIEIVAHETGHAFHMVTPKSAPPVKLVSRICADVTEEITTRRIESLVVSEIQKTTVGARELKGFTFDNGGTDPDVVERDFYPAQLRMTYLEHFVLGERMRDAVQSEGLDAEGVKAKISEAAGAPLKGWRSRKLSSEYARLRFALRVIDLRWRRLKELHGSNAAAFARTKEQVLQEHANAFFGGAFAYTPRPAKRSRSVANPLCAKPAP